MGAIKIKLTDIVFFLAILLIVFSIFNVFFDIITYDSLRQKITGEVSNAYVNISVDPSLEINLSSSVVNWSVGTINAGEVNATLYTRGSSNGNVSRGNWSGVNAKAFIVENVGSSNCSLFFQASKNASTLFLSSSGSNQEYQWNASNKEPGACINSSGLDNGWTNWSDVNITSGGTKICSQIGYTDNMDEVYVDILLTVPYDALNTGSLTDTVTLTCNAI